MITDICITLGPDAVLDCPDVDEIFFVNGATYGEPTTLVGSVLYVNAAAIVALSARRI